MMDKNVRIAVLVVIVFVCGMFTQAKIYASLSKPVVVVPVVAQQAKPMGMQYGSASWYSEQDPGINERTANNEIFDDLSMTCAMWDIPFNKRVRVTNIENGKTITVRVNDRGPHKRFVRQGRVVDLTKGAFARLASPHKGLINVQLEVLD